jgi:hypothetical protein
MHLNASGCSGMQLAAVGSSWKQLEVPKGLAT